MEADVPRKCGLLVGAKLGKKHISHHVSDSFWSFPRGLLVDIVTVEYCTDLVYAPVTLAGKEIHLGSDFGHFATGSTGYERLHLAVGDSLRAVLRAGPDGGGGAWTRS